jgi:bacillithiol system protein YtxJ
MMNSFVDAYELSENELDLYYLDIISYRAVSNAVAHRFNVVHESPQILVIKNGMVVAQAGHGDISNLDLKDLV